MNETQPFSPRAWREIAPIYAAILELPFNQQLMAGTLDRERFQFYMLQDAYYLQDYARVLALAAARAPQLDAVVKFAEDAAGAVRVERALHEGYFAQFGMPAALIAATEPSPSCFSYTSFLLACAYHQPYEVLLAAILPCFWIYREVGSFIYAHAVAANPYQAWIDTYAGDAFGRAVQAAIDWTDEAARTTSAARREAMLAAFVRSSQLEWMFWDSAYRRETWPI